MLEYVGFYWVIFGYDGYNLVTVVSLFGGSPREYRESLKGLVKPQQSRYLGYP